MDSSLITQILLVLLGVVVLWVILRFLLRLTARFFACGCGLIVFAGLAALFYIKLGG